MNKTISLGIARKDITPKLGCQLYGYNPDHKALKLLDSLRATAYVFEYEGKKMALISAEVCVIASDLNKRIRNLIEKECGIKTDDILLAAIHTHTGPNTAGSVGWGEVDNEYCDETFIPQIIAAVKEAATKCVPVKMGIAVGDSKVGINRRQTLPDYSICLGQNEWGYYNPQMTVISFKDENNNVVGNIVHYAAHPTSLGTTNQISRDWPGIMVDSIERFSGATTIFLNGCEGDVGPRLTNGATVASGKGEDAAISCMREVGGLAAIDAVRIYSQIKSFNEVSAELLTGTVTIPLKERISIEEAKKHLAEIPADSVNWRAATRSHCERVIKAYENNVPPEKDEIIKQSILHIGDIAFIGLPYEPFSQIGMMIQKFSNIPYSLCISNANGCLGYFPTNEELCRGGYEINSFKTKGTQPYADDADQSLIFGTLNNLKKLS